jgi:hypothetical protein
LQLVGEHAFEWLSMAASTPSSVHSAMIFLHRCSQWSIFIGMACARQIAAPASSTAEK